jgi:hypothetical protein
MDVMADGIRFSAPANLSSIASSSAESYGGQVSEEGGYGGQVGFQFDEGSVGSCNRDGNFLSDVNDAAVQ